MDNSRRESAMKVATEASRKTLRTVSQSDVETVIIAFHRNAYKARHACARWLASLLIAALLFYIYLACVHSESFIKSFFLQISDDGGKKEATLLVMANGAGELYADGKLVTSWVKPCSLLRVHVPATALIAIFVDKQGDNAAFGLDIVNATAPPSNQWRCVQQEAVTDWMKPEVTDDTSWPFAKSRLRDTACQSGFVDDKTLAHWTHLTYTSHWVSVQLYCRTQLALAPLPDSGVR